MEHEKPGLMAIGTSALANKLTATDIENLP